MQQHSTLLSHSSCRRLASSKPTALRRDGCGPCFCRSARDVDRFLSRVPRPFWLLAWKPRSWTARPGVSTAWGVHFASSSHSVRLWERRSLARTGKCRCLSSAARQWVLSSISASTQCRPRTQPATLAGDLQTQSTLSACSSPPAAARYTCPRTRLAGCRAVCSCRSSGDLPRGKTAEIPLCQF